MIAFRRAGELALLQADAQTLADAAWGLMASAEFSNTDDEAVALLAGPSRPLIPRTGRCGPG